MEWNVPKAAPTTSADTSSRPKGLMRNILLGLVVAGGLALAVSPVTVAGIAAWKIVLAAFGAVLFVTAGSRRSA